MIHVAKIIRNCQSKKIRCPVFAGLTVNSPPKMRASSLSSHASMMGLEDFGNANAGMFLPVKPLNISLSELLLDPSDNADRLTGHMRNRNLRKLSQQATLLHRFPRIKTNRFDRSP